MIKIKKVENLSSTNEKLKGVRGQVVYGKTLSLLSVANLCSQSNTLTQADALGVFSAFFDEVISCLNGGYSVDLGAIGHFRPTIKNKFAPTLEDWKISDNVKKVNVVYTPSTTLKQALNLAAENVNVQVIG